MSEMDGCGQHGRRYLVQEMQSTLDEILQKADRLCWPTNAGDI